MTTCAWGACGTRRAAWATRRGRRLPRLQISTPIEVEFASSAWIRAFDQIQRLVDGAVGVDHEVRRQPAARRRWGAARLCIDLKQEREFTQPSKCNTSCETCCCISSTVSCSDPLARRRTAWSRCRSSRRAGRCSGSDRRRTLAGRSTAPRGGRRRTAGRPRRSRWTARLRIRRGACRVGAATTAAMPPPATATANAAASVGWVVSRYLRLAIESGDVSGRPARWESSSATSCQRVTGSGWGSPAGARSLFDPLRSRTYDDIR